MTRKDIILIAVVINAGLLAILFMTAMIYDPAGQLERTEFLTPVTAIKNGASDRSTEAIDAIAVGDEVDHVLKYYAPADPHTLVNMQQEMELQVPSAVQSNTADDDESEVEQTPEHLDENHFITISVKKGDMLEKIARAHGVSVQAIKQANGLQSERLSVGQVLKVPSKKENNAGASNISYVSKETSPTESMYYVVKAGDNPWKIAKQFNIKVEDIIRLNHLDEEKARNLKIGDRIRVK